MAPCKKFPERKLKRNDDLLLLLLQSLPDKTDEIRRRGRFLRRGGETAENEERVGRARTSRERATSDEDDDDDREKEKAIVFCA